jgi:hypothetical protein
MEQLRSFQDALIVRNVVARTLLSFAKYHPIFNIVERAAKVIEKAYPSALRFSGIASRHEYAYKGDRSKIQPNQAKAVQAIDLIMRTAESIEAPVVKYKDEFQRVQGSDIQEQLSKWVNKFVVSLKEAKDSDYRTMRPAALNSYVENALDDLRSGVKNVKSFIQMAAKIPEEGPEYEDSASDEEKFKAHQTTQITSMAKTCAKKLGNKMAPCVALGMRVLEDVNASSALRGLEGMIGHYEKEVAEEDWDKVGPLVSRVSTAIDFGIIEAGAFLCVLMQLVRAPETGRVFSALTNEFSEYF